MNSVLTPELLIPFIISNALAIGILWLTFIKQNVAQAMLAVLFLGAGGFNIYTAFTNPVAYQAYADTSFAPSYKDFITGFFADNTIIIVSAIAVGQIFIGIAMLMEGSRFRFGCVGGFIFGMAIAPLGIGSAFPSTVILALSFLVLLFKMDTSRINRRAAS